MQSIIPVLMGLLVLALSCLVGFVVKWSRDSESRDEKLEKEMKDTRHDVNGKVQATELRITQVEARMVDRDRLEIVERRITENTERAVRDLGKEIKADIAGVRAAIPPPAPIPSPAPAPTPRRRKS